MQLIGLAVAAAQTFDVDAATRAYLATLSGAARARSDAYFEGGYWLLLWGALVSAAIGWLLLQTGWSARFSGWAARTGRARWLHAPLYAIPFVIVSTLIALPWTIYTDFIREKQYGLMNQGFGAWLGEQGISLLVQIVVIALLLLLVFAVIRRAPRWWWLFGALAMLLFSAIGAVIAPLFIMPLFNDYTPMPASPMRDQIMAMAHANHIPAENIYVVDASKQSKRISANVSGLGPTIRISLNDNLLHRASPAEIKAVMGHEMGHYVLNHIWWGLAEFGLIFLAAFLLLWWLAPRLIALYGGRWGVHDVSDPAVTPLFVIIVSLFGLLATPLVNSISRTHESEADVFGLNAAREPDGFAAVAMKLSEYRKIQPGPLEEILFYDHPSGATRVRMSMQWKADHLGEKTGEVSRLLIFGPGYTATRIAAAAAARGWSIRTIGRDMIDDRAIVAGAVNWSTHILSSVPPDATGDPVLERHAPTLAASGRIIAWLSSTGVYGDSGAAWLDESAPLVPGRRPARVAADRAWAALSPDVSIFRLPGIYGPGSSALDRLADGTARRVDCPGHVFSRIHVDDIVAAVLQGLEGGPAGTYNLADDCPAPQAEVVAYAASLRGVDPPPIIPVAALPPSAQAFYTASRRIAAGKARRLLGWRPLYPDYRTGLRALTAITNPSSVSSPPAAACSDQT